MLIIVSFAPNNTKVNTVKVISNRLRFPVSNNVFILKYLIVNNIQIYKVLPYKKNIFE